MPSSADKIHSAVGILGNIISYGLFLSPTPTFAKIWKKKAVEQYSPAPYLATLMNCMLWVFYGLPFVTPDSILVFTTNIVGFFLELIYISLFLAFSSNKYRLTIVAFLVVEAAFFAMVVAVTMTKLHVEHKSRSRVVGIIADVFCIGMYAAPLTIMRKVIKTKSVKYMPLYLSLASLANGVCWTAYALIKFDLYILIPNGLGTMLGLAQLILYMSYRRSTPSDEDDKMIKPELQLPTVRGENDIEK